jgi:2-aminoadipate transaminase
MNYTFSSFTDGLKSSAVRDILKLTQGNAVISLAGGLPAEEHFPIEAVKEAFERVFQHGGKSSLQYGLTEGYTPLREAICQRMAKKGASVKPENMLITTGSQQAIYLLTRIYMSAGDVVLVENPTYLAALQIFQASGVRVVGVEADQDGMLLDDLEAKLKRHRPKMVYVTPTFANPTGKVWSLERRKGLLALCKPNNVLILEDDPYGEIQFDEKAEYPSIFSLDDHPEGSAVMYTSTFSKTVVPALRTGWIIGDSRVIAQMAKAKQAVDLHSSTLDQQALHQLLTHFDLDAHIRTIRNEYPDGADEIAAPRPAFLGSALERAAGRNVFLGRAAGEHRCQPTAQESGGERRRLRSRHGLLRREPAPQHAAPELHAYGQRQHEARLGPFGRSFGRIQAERLRRIGEDRHL